MRASGILAGMLFVASAAAVAAQPSLDEARRAERHYRTGVELMMSERWDRAAEEFESAIGLDRLMAMAHYNLGQCRMAQQRFVEAVTAYVGAREAFEAQGTLSQKDRNDRERARQDEINELKDSLIRLRTVKGASPQDAIRIEERLRTLESMRNRNFQDDRSVPAEVYLALGSAYFRQDKLSEAEREYREAVKINDKLGPAHNNLAVIYLLTGRVDEAEASMKKAERNGFRVHPQFKEDLKLAKQKQ